MKNMTELEKLVRKEGKHYKEEYRGIPFKLRRGHGKTWFGTIFINPDLDLDTDDIEVHGGITYEEYIDGYRKIGFDCAHAGDAFPDPQVSRFLPQENSKYRTKEFVINECRSVIDQIIELCDLEVEN